MPDASAYIHMPDMVMDGAENALVSDCVSKTTARKIARGLIKKNAVSVGGVFTLHIECG